MDDIKKKIISLIEKNKISTVEVSDALGKRGVLPGFKPLTKGRHIVGEVAYVFTYHESNWPLHKQVETIEECKVVFVDAFDCGEKALFGDIVAKYISLYKSSKAIIANGLVRDAHTLLKENYPIWSLGTTPLGCDNKDVKADAAVLSAAEKRAKQLNQSLLIADDSGVAIIEKDEINEITIKKLEFIELQEDIWYYCIDTLKWSTYKTICEKAYLKAPNVLPDVLRAKLAEFDL
ncbi:RraA family protein [Leptospira adleri]|uniref:Putative 4-hydroxy-4-methyl-2-oxoglutarate aldolase n=1 Tax=Leptospira adleri TaxID=2023186 RepID=A0ABX4NY93_9LEPT|nr:RraA family protein [Leptospira adleri]PJZ61813.1 demethylmenaquinone methyltransferase [Leptospira adleri]